MPWEQTLWTASASRGVVSIVMLRRHDEGWIGGRSTCETLLLGLLPLAAAGGEGR